MSIKESTRKLFEVGKYSKAVTVPIDWVKFNEWLRKEELRELHCSVNDILVMSPEEKKEKVRKFLLLYERLSSEEVDRLLKLFERLSPEEIDRLLRGKSEAEAVEKDPAPEEAQEVPTEEEKEKKP